MKLPKFSVLGLLFYLLFFGGCKKEPSDHSSPPPPADQLTPYNLKVPNGFPKPILSNDNPLTVEGVRLGRMLFYESALSSNGRSCSYCHHQDRSFMVPNSLNHLDPQKYENIMPLINEAWNSYFEWWGTSSRLEDVPPGDFTPDFFNPNLDSVVNRLKRNPVYADLFNRVFHGENVLTREKVVPAVSKALAQFIRTIISSNSKFDQYKRGEAVLTQAELNGMTLFFTEKGDCFHCHGTVLFTDGQFHNNGLNDNFQGFNKGRFNATGNVADIGKFKSPTLRNIALTAPYMHDGRFATLSEVIQFYNSGVKKSSTLDPIMTLPGKESGLHLSQMDMQDLEAFLNTLTDSTVLTNPDLSRP